MNQLATICLSAADPIGDAVLTSLHRTLAFFAPVIAVLIGIIGLKFLFGEKKSLVGFLGFLILGVAAYFALRYVVEINFFLKVNEEAFAWAAGIIAALFACYLAYESWPDRGKDRQPPPWKRAARIEHTKTALVALDELGATDRLRDQVRLTMIVAVERDLFAPGSPVTPAHVAKWVALRDRWPEIVDGLWSRPDLLRELEETPAEDLRQFLGTGPPLHPVAQHLTYMTPRLRT